MSEPANRSGDPFVPPPTDGGGKGDPGVPPARLIARLKREADEYEDFVNHNRRPWTRGRLAGLRRAIEIIQANEGS